MFTNSIAFMLLISTTVLLADYQPMPDGLIAGATFSSSVSYIPFEDEIRELGENFILLASWCVDLPTFDLVKKIPPDWDLIAYSDSGPPSFILLSTIFNSNTTTVFNHQSTPIAMIVRAITDPLSIGNYSGVRFFNGSQTLIVATDQVNYEKGGYALSFICSSISGNNSWFPNHIPNPSISTEQMYNGLGTEFNFITFTMDGAVNQPFHNSGEYGDQVTVTSETNLPIQGVQTAVISFNPEKTTEKNFHWLDVFISLVLISICLSLFFAYIYIKITKSKFQDWMELEQTT